MYVSVLSDSGARIRCSCIFHNGVSTLKLIMRTLNVNNVNVFKSNRVGEKAKARERKTAEKNVQKNINLIKNRK
jgi:hypothetical protein